MITAKRRSRAPGVRYKPLEYSAPFLYSYFARVRETDLDPRLRPCPLPISRYMFTFLIFSQRLGPNLYPSCCLFPFPPPYRSHTLTFRLPTTLRTVWRYHWQVIQMIMNNNQSWNRWLTILILSWYHPQPHSSDDIIMYHKHKRVCYHLIQ